MTTTEAPPINEPPPASTPAPAAPIPPKASESLLANLRITRPAAPQESQSTPTPTDDPPKTEDPKPNDPNPAPKLDPPVKKIEDPAPKMSENARTEFQKLEKKWKQAEADRDTFKKQFDSLKSEAETLRSAAKEVEDARSELERVKKEKDVIHSQLKAASIERDPDFKKRFDGEILAHQEQMLSAAVSAGTSREDFIQALRVGNEAALEEIREALPPHQQRAWDSHRIDIEKIAHQRQDALRDADQTWGQMEEERQKAFEADEQRRSSKNSATARSIVDEFWNGLPEEERLKTQDVRDEIKDWLSVAVVKATSEELMGELARGQIRLRALQGHIEEIDRLTKDAEAKSKEIDELKEKLGEQETFIKQLSSRSPRLDVGVNRTPSEENGSLLSRVRVRTPGQ